jgi:uncharacterized protein YjbI with pentapeptide repeats
MANEEQLSILKQGVEVWNDWRKDNPSAEIDLSRADLFRANLRGANLSQADISETNLNEAHLNRTNFSGAFLTDAKLREADMRRADFRGARLHYANLRNAHLNEAKLSKANLYGAILNFAELSDANLGEANLYGAKLSNTHLNGADLARADLRSADLSAADLRKADLTGADLRGANFTATILLKTNFSKAKIEGTIFGSSNLSYSYLSEAIGLEEIRHTGPSSISTDTFATSKGKIPEVFLRGCGLSDLEIEEVKLYDPDLSNDERNKILYRIYDLQASQAIQISPLFVSYSHGDSAFVEKVGDHLTKKGVRYWRDIHDMKAGRMEKQIDRAIRQSPTVLLVLSEHSLSSDWVEHEVRTARGLEKEMGRDVLCPVALDDSWKDSKWDKHLMEQVKKYHVLDFSNWKDDSKFDGMFRKLINGLELFYKG